MNLNKIILLLFHAYNKNIKGKTLIQKRMYFLSNYLGLDFGYFAHYYGPYSNDVNSALDANCGLGFLQESYNEYGFSQKRFDFKLTPDGQQLIDFLKVKDPDMAKKISTFAELMQFAGDNDDYNKLSYAAKVHYILNSLTSKGEIDLIKKQATFFGWSLSSQEIDIGLEFLTKFNKELKVTS